MNDFSDDMTRSAAWQLALDLNCQPEDFLESGYTIVPWQPLYGRRNIGQETDFFRAATFGFGTVISLSPEMYSFTKELTKQLPPLKLFDALGVYLINQKLEQHGMVLGEFHEYYLPANPEKLEFPPSFDVKIYQENEIPELYQYPEFSNALLFQNTKERRDVLATAVFQGGVPIGIAGASNDSKIFWQIGVDVLPKYRKTGVGKLLVSTLTKEILRCGAVPYYGTWWSNIASRRTALSCGYEPVWSELRAVSLP